MSETADADRVRAIVVIDLGMLTYEEAGRQASDAGPDCTRAISLMVTIGATAEHVAHAVGWEHAADG